MTEIDFSQSNMRVEVPQRAFISRLYTPGFVVTLQTNLMMEWLAVQKKTSTHEA